MAGPNFEILESQLSEVEMALLMAVDVAMNAAFLAGADPGMVIDHLEMHQRNFAALGKPKAANMMAVLQVLRRNAMGDREW